MPPVCLVTVGGPYGWVLFGINLACGLVGIVLNAVDLARWKKLSLVLYLIMGWMAVLAMPVMLHNLSRIGFLLILLGGLPTPLGWSSIGKRTSLTATASGISLCWPKHGVPFLCGIHQLLFLKAYAHYRHVRRRLL